MAKLKDLTGERFSRLLVVDWARLLNVNPYSLVWQRVRHGMTVRHALQVKSRQDAKDGK